MNAGTWTPCAMCLDDRCLEPGCEWPDRDCHLRARAQPWLTDPTALEEFHDMASRTIAVDFDGVLHPYTAGWTGSVPDDEPPTSGAHEFLDALVGNGYRVVVLSSRADHPEGHAGILDWLKEYGLDGFVEEVTHRKVAAVAYVDDRAVPFAGHFGPCLDAIDRLAQHRAHGAAPPDPPSGGNGPEHVQDNER